MPSWSKVAMDEWIQPADITCERAFRPISKGDRLIGEGMSAQTIYGAIKTYARLVGFTIAAHDTRRTFAKPSHNGGAATEHIQLTLRHQTLATAERYLGLEQDLTDAPCDHLGLRWEDQRA